MNPVRYRATVDHLFQPAFVDCSDDERSNGHAADLSTSSGTTRR